MRLLYRIAGWRTVDIECENNGKKETTKGYEILDKPYYTDRVFKAFGSWWYFRSGLEYREGEGTVCAIKTIRKATIDEIERAQRTEKEIEKMMSKVIGA
jgi:hypothetical protein